MRALATSAAATFAAMRSLLGILSGDLDVIVLVVDGLSAIGRRNSRNGRRSSVRGWSPFFSGKALSALLPKDLAGRRGAAEEPEGCPLDHTVENVGEQRREDEFLAAEDEE